MSDRFRIAVAGAFSVLAAVFSFAKYGAIPVMLILLAMKIAGALSLSFGFVFLIPLATFVFGGLLQAMFTVGVAEMLK